MTSAERPSARLFVALLLPESVREEVARAVAPLRGTLDGVRWVRTEQLHLTLRFIGAVQRSRVSAIGEALRTGLAPLPGLTLALEGGGAFPSPSRPSVLWAGVRPDDRLSALHAAAETALAGVGIEPETRDFHPHVTVGRIRRGRRAPEAGRAIADLAIEATARVREASLMESVLHRSGARHTRVERIPLAGE